MVAFRVMLARTTDLALVRTALRRSGVVALLGPRRCGKTTLAREFVSADSPNYFDLEDPASLARLAEPERIGVECKRADAPTLTPSMRIALTDLKLDQLIVGYPGERRYRLDKRVEVVPLAELVGAT